MGVWKELIRPRRDVFLRQTLTPSQSDVKSNQVLDGK